MADLDTSNPSQELHPDPNYVRRYQVLDICLRVHMAVTGSGDWIDPEKVDWLRWRVSRWDAWQGRQFDTAVLALAQETLREYGEYVSRP